MEEGTVSAGSIAAVRGVVGSRMQRQYETQGCITNGHLKGSFQEGLHSVNQAGLELPILLP